MNAAPAAPVSFARRVSGQAAMLLAAFGTGQALSLARNALLGHCLSRGEFGVAATITLVLQLGDMLSDIGVDRHILQSDDGDDSRVQASAHALLVARGALTALAILLLAHPIASFFRVPEATWAFQLAALTPFLRGFSHLDSRRLQRRYDNRAFVTLEILPQAIGLVLMFPALQSLPGYAAVAAVFVAQGLVATLASWLLAERPYQIRFDRHVIGRMVAFGWPIWLSAFPLVAVYQGERLIIGRWLGLEALAAFTVTFMAAMVPGLAAAKISNALMLPLLSAAREQPRRFVRRVRILSEATTLGASIYAAGFIIAGGLLIPLAFGPAYHDLGALAACLGTMWAIRMLQVVPGMALMSLGMTRPLLVAGCVRALALPAALLLALHGAGLTLVAATGVAGELASLIYVSIAADIAWREIGRSILRRALFLLPSLTLSALVASSTWPSGNLLFALASFTGVAAALTMAAFAGMPGLRRFVDLKRRVKAQYARLAPA